MYPVFTPMPGESYRRRLRSFVVVLMLRISSANELPCVLIVHERPGPRSVSDCDEVTDCVLFLHLKTINPLELFCPKRTPY